MYRAHHGIFDALYKMFYFTLPTSVKENKK